MSDIKEKVAAFIKETFILTDEKVELAEDQSLMDLGIIDSTGVFALIGFLEDSFGIAIADDEVLPENLDSIDLISAFVERKAA